MTTKAAWISTMRALAPWCAFAAAVGAPACGDQRGKLVPPALADAGMGGSLGGISSGGAGAGGTQPDLAGEGGLAGEGALGTAGGPGGEGGTETGGAASGESGAGASGEGHSPPTSAGAGGEGGELESEQGGMGGVPSSSDEGCVYRSDIAGSSQAGGGTGGEAALPTISKATNRLIGGEYLTDSSGLALYVFGADLAGDCRSAPVSDCAGDCLASWPVFHSDSRVLAAGLDPQAFGSIQRADGSPQTTYFGWPLYYYANDLKAGDVTGHGNGVWGLAQLTPPNVVVRRAGSDRFLADGTGRTLYAFTSDTLGSANNAPLSACVDGCRDRHSPFSPAYVDAISTLRPQDFVTFVRSDGDLQVAYRGAPLYFSDLDGRPGDMNGVTETDWTLVLR